MTSPPATVQQALQQAFGALHLPPASQLIRTPRSPDHAPEELLREALSGRTWQSLSPAFLEQWWAHFCYLSPEAYRYYLPALLWRAAECPEERAKLAHSVVFSLRPSFWALYYRGDDSHFRERQAVFSNAQYAAVVGYLGWVLQTDPPRLGHLAAQALRWGWNRLHTPALEACEAYYERLHHFAYPEAEDPELADLIHKIRNAFAATPYPGDDQLCGSDQGDEPAEYALELRGLRWQEIHPELLSQCAAALSFLSASGFRYFLPAFLVSDVLGLPSNADPVFHLTHGLSGPPEHSLWGVSDAELANLIGPERLESLEHLAGQPPTFSWRDYSADRFSAFTHGQRRAIILYLEYRARLDDYDAPQIEAALAGYWRPSAEAAAR